MPCSRRSKLALQTFLTAALSVRTFQAQRTDVLEATGMKVTGYADVSQRSSLLVRIDQAGSEACPITGTTITSPASWKTS